MPHRGHNGYSRCSSNRGRTASRNCDIAASSAWTWRSVSENVDDWPAPFGSGSNRGKCAELYISDGARARSRRCRCRMRTGRDLGQAGRPRDSVSGSRVPPMRKLHLRAHESLPGNVQPAPSRLSYKGEGVANFCGTATFAEYSVVQEIRLAKIREDVAPDVFCCIGCGVITGIGAALTTAKITPGSSVAVFGSGGIGLNVIAAARIAGAARIIGLDINPMRETVARQFGATDPIYPRNVRRNGRMKEVPGLSRHFFRFRPGLCVPARLRPKSAQ